MSNYRLAWGKPGHGDVYILSEEKTAAIVATWRKFGVVAGSLDEGSVHYTDPFGKEATITRA